MLIKLEVQNFRSIHKRQIFHMISQKRFKRFKEHIYDYNEDLGLLKTTGIYGSNGSGKTNIFKSIFFIKNLIEDSDYLNSDEASQILTPFALSDKSKNTEIIFKVDFIFEKNIYSYDLIVDSIGEKVLYEKLVCVTKDDKLIFERESKSNDNLIINFPAFRDHQDVLINLVKNKTHRCILSLADIIDDMDFLNAQKWFTEQIDFCFHKFNDFDIVYTLSKSDKYLELANELIRFSNIGIKKLLIESVDIDLSLTSKTDREFIKKRLKNKKFHAYKDSNKDFVTAIKTDTGFEVLKLIVIHENDEGKEVRFDIAQESTGTIIFIQNLLPAIILSYHEGITYFIDEINRSLHPIFLKELLTNYFNNISWQSVGQIIFNTHEDFIMDEKMMRQDEIWFVEKDSIGQTEIFPLADFPNIRFDLNLRKNYLNGKFGAVPFKKEPKYIKFNAN